MKVILVSELEALPADAIQELRAGAEECLNGTVTLALAADQRATTLAGIFGAGSVGVLAAYVAIPSASHSTSLTGAVACLALLFFFASMLAAWASRSVDFYVAGYEPRNRLKVATNADWLIQDSVVDLQRRIDANRHVLASGGQKINIALGVAIAALPSAGVSYLVF